MQRDDRLLVLLFLCGCEGLVVLSARYHNSNSPKGFARGPQSSIESLFSLRSYRL